jgi:hypothetical protein
MALDLGSIFGKADAGIEDAQGTVESGKNSWLETLGKIGSYADVGTKILTTGSQAADTINNLNCSVLGNCPTKSSQVIAPTPTTQPISSNTTTLPVQNNAQTSNPILFMPPAQYPTPTQSSGLGTGAIIGIVAGIVAFLVLIIVLVMKGSGSTTPATV